MLIQRAKTVWTGIEAAPRLDDVSIRVTGAEIEEIGQLEPIPGELRFDASECVIAPGWVNTHHHFFQSLLKAVPGSLDLDLSHWSASVSLPFRGRFDAEIFRLSVRLALCELVMSGCTTVADHQFLAYPGIGFDCAEILFDEARRFGVRMVLCRGGMTVAPNWDGDLPLWLKPETVDEIADNIEALTARFHDHSPVAVRRIAVAPTILTHRVRKTDLNELAALARKIGLRLHSHLNETRDDNDFCRAAYGCSALDLCEETGWLGPDVWFAHLVYVDSADIERLARSGTGLAHCPASNARLGGGVAPAVAMARAGIPVSFGVDGAGSNESADMLSEMHFSWLLHHSRRNYYRDEGNAPPDVARIIGWASAGGADVLGLGVGRLRPGAPADLGIYHLDDLAHHGMHDPATALVISSARPSLRLLLRGGTPIVRDGNPVSIDVGQLKSDVRAAMHKIVDVLS